MRLKNFVAWKKQATCISVVRLDDISTVVIAPFKAVWENVPKRVVYTSNQQTDSDERTIKEYVKQIISTTLDVLIIANFKEESFSVYDVTEYIKNQFDVVLSSGTLYSTVYTMERQGLLQAFYGHRKRLFKATSKGLNRTNLLLNSKEIAVVAEKMTRL